MATYPCGRCVRQQEIRRAIPSLVGFLHYQNDDPRQTELCFPSVQRHLTTQWSGRNMNQPLQKVRQVRHEMQPLLLHTMHRLHLLA